MTDNWLPLSSFPSRMLELNLESLRDLFPEVAEAVEKADPAGIDLLPLERGLFALRRTRGNRVVMVHDSQHLDRAILEGFSFMNPRNFDVPMRGGFLPSEWIPCAPNFFEPGKDLAFFNRIDDLRDKVWYYLDCPEERERLVSNACRRIMAEHTYGHRMGRLLSLYYDFQKRMGGVSS